MKPYSKKAVEGAKIILFKLGTCKKTDRVCIISDSSTKNTGNIFHKLAESKGIFSQHFTIKPLKMHGQEPPKDVAKNMEKSTLTLGITSLSMAHTKARKKAELKGTRYLSLPDFNEKLLSHPSLRVDYFKLGKIGKKISKKLSDGKTVKIKTKVGTNIEFDIHDRKANFTPGYVNKKILLGSPPDIEVNICPIENSANGIIVVDGSIPYLGIGKLTSKIKINVRNGKIFSMDGNSIYTDKLNRLFSLYGTKSKTLAEFGIGFNSKSKLCGNMLIDEGSYGTFHFGFGSNFTMGGNNNINFHLDFIIFANKFELDGKPIKI